MYKQDNMYMRVALVCCVETFVILFLPRWVTEIEAVAFVCLVGLYIIIELLLAWGDASAKKELAATLRANESDNEGSTEYDRF